MDIVEELYKWQQSHTKEEWELASKETEHFMEGLDGLNEVEFFIKYHEQNYDRTIAVINRK